MNSYILFIPGARTAGREAFELAGLGDLATDARCFDSHSTPTGGIGKFFAWGDPRNPAKNIGMEYAPDRQTWQESPTGKYWFGWFNDRVPDPVSLERPRHERIDGRYVVLGDDNPWLLPTISNLPVSFRLMPSGDKERVVKPRWSHLQSRMLWAWSQIERQVRDGIDPDESDCLDYLAEVLCVNYRLAPEMAFMLGLVDSKTWADGVTGTMDRERLIRLREAIVTTGESQTPAP